VWLVWLVWCRLREDTLKSLVEVVEKLDEQQLQDKLVRCICNLQGDAEASVRTNAVIFLSRITSKLTPAVRQRVLTSSYCKAMKDTFVHCR
jgi:SCY1-like protein 1